MAEDDTRIMMGGIFSTKVHTESEYLGNLLSKPDFKVLVAKHDNKVIGGLTVYVLHNYFSTRPIA